MKYEKYKELKDKAIYTSKAAEFRRNIWVKKTIYVNSDIKKTFSWISKDVTKSTDQNFFEGEELGKNAFITKYVIDKSIGYEQLKDDGFYATSYELSKHRTGGTNIKVTFSLKLRNRTITGMNGKLASLKWKMAARKILAAAEKRIKEQISMLDKQ